MNREYFYYMFIVQMQISFYFIMDPIQWLHNILADYGIYFGLGFGDKQ